MEVLAQELAKALNVTVEKAIELLPILRRQFIAHSMIETVLGMIWILFGVSMAVNVGLFIGYCIYLDGNMTPKEEEQREHMGKILKTSCTVALISALVIITGRVLQIGLAPDYSILLKFLAE